jgi:capping protein beta
MDAALDLMRRLPPQRTEDNLNNLFELKRDDEFQEEVRAAVDQPLRVAKCPSTQKDFLVCDYNRDFSDDGKESFRSPWSNEYEPPLAGTVPSTKLRQMEVAINDAFETYKQMYYDQGGNIEEETGGTSVSSVYLWDLEHDGSFAAAILIKKSAYPFFNEANGLKHKTLVHGIAFTLSKSMKTRRRNPHPLTTSSHPQFYFISFPQRAN